MGDPAMLNHHATNAAGIAEEMARNLRHYNDPRFGNRVLREALEVSLPVLVRELEQACSRVDPPAPCGGTFPHTGPWEKIPGSDQASRCACGEASGK